MSQLVDKDCKFLGRREPNSEGNSAPFGKPFGATQRLHVGAHEGKAGPKSAFAFLSVHEIDGRLFGLIDTRPWGTGLIFIAAVLTIWSMVYYLQKALPEIRAKAR